MAREAHSGNTSVNRFENILNFRDVGATINQLSGRPKYLREGLLFRSARPDGSTATDRSSLRETFKIRTIVDLRSKTEHIAAAKKHSDAVAIAQSAVVPATNDSVSGPLKISGIDYENINLNGKGFERALLWKLRWFDLAKLITWMTLGYRTDGIAILGREVMQPRGLTGLAIDTLQHSGDEIKQVFDVLAQETKYPILIHCTQGKDRTGLIILLVLMLCGVHQVDMRAITSDYVMSEKELEPENEERLKEIRSIGLDETFAACPPDFVEKVTGYIQDQYNGAGDYLEHIGIPHDKQTRIKTILSKRGDQRHATQL